MFISLLKKYLTKVTNSYLKSISRETSNLKQARILTENFIGNNPRRQSALQSLMRYRIIPGVAV